MKKLARLLFVLGLALALTACGASGNGNNADDSEGKGEEETNNDPIKLVVGATAVPHAEILEHIQPALKEQGVELEIKTFTDYVLPNKELVEGELDANYFQHIPYMKTLNEENNWNIVDVVGVHIEPMGGYSNKYQSLDELPDGATVALPDDTSQTDRVLLLLEANGLVTLEKKEGNKSINDIKDNPKNLNFKSVEAALLPRVLNDVDLAVINTNFALEADLNPLKDAIFLEDETSPYVNVLAVNAGDEDKPGIKELVAALTSDDVKQFIEEKYEGAVVPAFTNN